MRNHLPDPAAPGESRQGVNTGNRFVVFDVYAADPVTALHESVHDLLFAKTPDGMAHRFMVALLVYGGEFPGRSVLQASYDRIASNSSRAHEAAAHYLTIKQLPDKIQPTAFRSLKDEHKRRFRDLGDVIDAQCESVTLQTIVANSMAGLAFSSRFISRLPGIDLATPIELAQEEQPTHRLLMITDALGPAAFADMISHLSGEHAAACQRLGIPAWDITSEAAWRENIHHCWDVSGAIDDATRTWLERACGLPTPSVAETQASARALVARAESLGVPPGTLVYLEHKRDHDRSATFIQGIRSLAESMIVNKSPVRAPRGSDRALYDPRMLAEVSRFVLLAEPGQSSDLLWDMLVRRAADDQDEWVGKFGHSAILHWLQACQAVARVCGRGPTPTMVMVAESLAQLPEFDRPIRDLLEILQPGGRGPFAGCELIWYVDLNYVEFLEWAIESARSRNAGRVAAGTLFFPLASTAAQTVGWGGLSVTTARLPEAVGLFVRIFPEYLGHSIEMTARQFQERGDLLPIPGSDMLRYEPLLKEVIQTVGRHWVAY